MKPLIRAVEQSNLRNECQIGQLVTYRYVTGCHILCCACCGTLHMFSFSYFVGRKAIFDSDFKAGITVLYCTPYFVLLTWYVSINFLVCMFSILADENLTFAFERCHRAAKRNKRSVLCYQMSVILVCKMLSATENLCQFGSSHYHFQWTLFLFS